MAILVAFSLGGILKGATGAGAPIITIPVIAAFYDVRIAVIIMVIPNLLTNIGQLYQFRKTILPKFFTLSFALGGGVGAFLGTILLVNLSIKILTLSVAFIVIVYIFLKIMVPSWKLTYKKAKKLVFLMGSFGGILQGTAGLSAPISITFLNSM
ncbi:MAG: sulfite exporter TauE/SafE family protein, partial [Alphaproteobacteria bacterium]|nr:sulfite exporter TauE/SafE family protein [Alphaproteobacteria bacterium]